MSPLPPAPASNLFLVCGGGATAHVAIEELALTGRRFSVIERDPLACALLRRTLSPDRVIEGDATDEEVLRRAGATEARALIATLREEKLNLVVAVIALQVNPALRVICRSDDESQWARLRRAGALIVSPAHIGGRRLAASMIHPQTVSFLNEMLVAPSEKPIRFEAVLVTAGSEGDGKTLGELDVYRRAGIEVVAVCRGTSDDFRCNPAPDTRLSPGDRLIVIGDRPAVGLLASLVGRWE